LSETEVFAMRAFRLFRSGDLVPESGVYAVLHSTPHAVIQHVSQVEGARFHECRMCPLGVWYRLEAPYLGTFERLWSHAPAAEAVI
jgi:hypothetical protein